MAELPAYIFYNFLLDLPPNKSDLVSLLGCLEGQMLCRQGTTQLNSCKTPLSYDNTLPSDGHAPGRSIESIRRNPQTIQAGPRAVRLAAAGIRFQDLASPPPSLPAWPWAVLQLFFRPMVYLHHEGARVKKKKKREYRMPARRHWAGDFWLGES